MAFRDCSVKVTVSQFCLQNRQTALHLAAWRGHTNVVETLIQYGADITVEDGVRIKLGISNDKTCTYCSTQSSNWMRIHT